MDDASSEFRYINPVKLGKLVVSLGFDYEKGCWLPCIYWSGVGSTLLMNPKQGETNQHKGMKCDVVNSVS